MAIWQIDIDFLPKEKTDFTGFKVKQSSIEQLELALPLGKSWSEKLKVYGTLDDTCLCIWYEDNAIDYVYCRLSLQDLTKERVFAILDFATENDLMLSVDEQQFEPTLEMIKEIILKSDANRFCGNPHKFLKELRENRQNNDS